MICPCCGQVMSAAREPSASSAQGNMAETSLAFALPSADADVTQLGYVAAGPRAMPLGGFDPAMTVPAYSPGLTPLAGPPESKPRNAAEDLVGKPLGPRYQIQKLLGAGGMGAVYAAWDRDLAIAVALKTVRPEVAADPETAAALEQRFKQELLLARQVTHKNIVRVYDMGEVDGIKYITMPYLA